MKIILASASPRRKELLGGLGLAFDVRQCSHKETYPASLPADDVAEYISHEKAAACPLADDELCIAADTVVILGSEIMGKPADEADAARMLSQLSGQTHRVVTGVTMKTTQKEVSFSVTSHVTFKVLSHEEIDYYVKKFHPLDKAGAYGIQEWIGYIGVTRLEGSYFNVMGLPIQRIYERLQTDFQVSPLCH